MTVTSTPSTPKKHEAFPHPQSFFVTQPNTQHLNSQPLWLLGQEAVVLQLAKIRILAPQVMGNIFLGGPWWPLKFCAVTNIVSTLSQPSSQGVHFGATQSVRSCDVLCRCA